MTKPKEYTARWQIFQWSYKAKIISKARAHLDGRVTEIGHVGQLGSLIKIRHGNLNSTVCKEGKFHTTFVSFEFTEETWIDPNIDPGHYFAGAGIHD